MNRRLQQNDYETMPEVRENLESCPYNSPNDDIDHILRYKTTGPGKEVQKGAKLRILPVGDLITVRFLNERNRGNGNGYRGQLYRDLSGISAQEQTTAARKANYLPQKTR